LPAILGIYTGLVTLMLHEAKRWLSLPRLVVLFAGLWVLIEYARGHLFTGFPWNLIGYVWTASDATLQFASVVGVYGMSWLTALVATIPALFFVKTQKRNAIGFTILACCMLLAMTSYGFVRLATHPTQYTDIKVRIVQGNVAQRLKWDPQSATDGL